MDHSVQILGNFFKSLRKRKNQPLSNKDIAYKLGVPKSTIDNITSFRAKTVDINLQKEIRKVFYEEGNEYLTKGSGDDDLIISEVLKTSEEMKKLSIDLAKQVVQLLKENKELKKQLNTLKRKK